MRLRDYGTRIEEIARSAVAALRLAPVALRLWGEDARREGFRKRLTDVDVCTHEVIAK